ncbi:Hsp33 family molecular chaperone HslO [Weissella kandleri]|uniref:Hsp33 family molecular chaperone HslO n=1 Tax=Weissella kandleri TaxID=1616 RepID=UPI00387E8A9B
MADTIVRAVTKDNNFRAIAMDGTQMLQKASKFHQATPLGVEILGKALISSLLVANAVLKGDERLAVTLDGQGPAGKIVTEASATGLVRGYVTNPRIVTDSVSAAVGIDGFLQITKEMDEESKPFTGSVQLANGQIDDDFTYYMLTSEQIPSVVMARVKINANGQVEAAGGVIVSALPDAKEDALKQFYAAVDQMPDLADVLMENHAPLDLLSPLFGAGQVKQLSIEEVNLYPDITKADYARMLETLHASQLQEMIDDGQGAEIVDRFTGNKIQFSTAELQNILEQQ